MEELFNIGISLGTIRSMLELNPEINDLTNKEVIESAIKMFDDTINEFKELYTESK